MNRRESTHDMGDESDEVDELLAAALAGDVADDDARLRALPDEPRRRLAGMRRIQRELDASAARERELLGQLDRPAVPRPARSWQRRAGFAAMAAGLLLLAYAARTLVGPKAEERRPAGSGSLGAKAAIEPLHPIGAVADLAPFRWRDESDAASGGGVRLSLQVWRHDAAAAGGKGERVVEQEVAADSWRPPSGLSLPDHVIWRVDLLPFEGERQPGREVEAWRRR